MQFGDLSEWNSLPWPIVQARISEEKIHKIFLLEIYLIFAFAFCLRPMAFLNVWCARTRSAKKVNSGRGKQKTFFQFDNCLLLDSYWPFINSAEQLICNKFIQFLVFFSEFFLFGMTQGKFAFGSGRLVTIWLSCESSGEMVGSMGWFLVWSIGQGSGGFDRVGDDWRIKGRCCLERLILRHIVTSSLSTFVLLTLSFNSSLSTRIAFKLQQFQYEKGKSRIKFPETNRNERKKLNWFNQKA